MESIVDSNLLKIVYNILLDDAFAYWAMDTDKSFFACFQKSLDKNMVKIEEKGIDLNVPPREVLKNAINSVKTTVVVQQVCYAYEILYKNYNPGLNIDKTSFEKLKSNVLKSHNNFNNDQLLNLIRNSISHNDDMDNPSYNYSLISEVFTFLPTKKKKSNNEAMVKINESELVELIVHYLKNLNGYKQLGYRLNVNLDRINSKKAITNTNDFITLKNLETGEIIPPDVHQIKVIKELITRIRNGEINQIDNLNFFYPYRQNTLNNFIKTSDFYHILNCLYKLRSVDFDTFIEKTELYTPSCLSEIKNFGDISNMFVINRLFQVFSTTPNHFLQENLENPSKNINFSKLRNAVMHGTYYKDADANLYIYDAPRPKTEEMLEYVDTFSLEQLEILSLLFFVTKHKIKDKKR